MQGTHFRLLHSSLGTCSMVTGIMRRSRRDAHSPKRMCIPNVDDHVSTTMCVHSRAMRVEERPPARTNNWGMSYSRDEAKAMEPDLSRNAITVEGHLGRRCPSILHARLSYACGAG